MSNNRFITAITILLIIPIILSSCNSPSKYTSTASDSFMPSNSQIEAGGIMHDTGSAADMSASPKQENIGAIASSNRKVISTARFQMETKEFTKTVTQLNEEVANINGYIAYSNTSGKESDGNAYAEISVRIPSDFYNQFKQVIITLGNVTSTSESGQDITMEYFDIQARLTTLEAQEKRILELLSEATKIEDLISIETELTRIRSEIERLTASIKNYDNLIEYATVTVNIRQSSEYTISQNSLSDKISNAFSESIRTGGVVIEYIIIALVWLFPYLLVTGIITFTVVFICKKRRKSKPCEIVSTVVNDDTPPIPPVNNDNQK